MGQFTVDLSGKSAIVTGGGSGIGRAVVLSLAAAGASVCINDINPDTCESVADEINASGGKAFGWQADIANRFQVGSLIEEARDRFGKIDILVNAAGVRKSGPMAKLDEWDWRRVMDVNLTGTFFVTQLMGRVMADEGGGTIVCMAPTAAHASPGGEPVSYVASKAGVIGMAQQAANELAPHGIRVNVVCHGGVITPEIPEPDVTRVPLGRAGHVDEVANVVLFLCSNAASFVNGQVIHVDGGQTMV